MYFSGPWEYILELWQYFKIILFKITNKTNLTWPYLTNLTYPSLTLPAAAKGVRTPSAALKFLVFEVLKFDARGLIKKVTKIG